MRACVQRVLSASVTVDEEMISRIETGFVVLLGIEQGDTERDAAAMVRKLVGLRVFNDPDGKMNLSIEQVNGAMLVVSQFTLCGDCRKGRRPSFVNAAKPEQAVPLYEWCVQELRRQGIHVETGKFQADMQVALVNDGPVTLLIDTNNQF